MRLGRSGRAVEVLFPALLGPLQLFLVGPHTIYVANQSEFSASFWRLAFEWLPAFVTLVVLLLAVALILPDRVRRVYTATLFGIGLTLWLQGNVFVVDYGLLDGQGMDWSTHTSRAPYEWAMWIAIPVACIAAARPLQRVIVFGCQLFIGLQLVVVVGAVVQGSQDVRGVWEGPPDEIFELSRTRNVIHLVLDGFQSDVFQEVVERDRDEADRLFSGFVFYADHTGAFPTTFVSLPAMLTGVAYRNQQPIRQFIDEQFQHGSILSALKAYGFDVDVLSAMRYAAADVTHAYRIPRPYATYADYARFSAWQLIDLTLFRHAPHDLKQVIYNEQAWRLQVLLGQGDSVDVESGRYLPVNGKVFLDEFSERLQVVRERPVYKYLHVGIPHWPVVLDGACEFIGPAAMTRDGYVEQARCAVKTVGRLMDRLRALGVYGNSLIVLSSDHGVGLEPRGFTGERETSSGPLSVVAGTAMPLLAIKAPGQDGPLRVSNVPTTITDIPATILDMLNLPQGALDGTPASVLGESSKREREYAAYRWRNENWRQPFFQYLDLFTIAGDPRHGANWTYRETIYAPDLARGARTRGLFTAEQDPRGEQFRWSGPHVVFHGPPDARQFTIAVRSVAPTPQTVSAWIDGQEVDSVLLDASGWHTLQYPLERSVAGDDVLVELRVSPPWVPGGGDNRRLGVMTRGVEWGR